MQELPCGTWVLRYEALHKSFFTEGQAPMLRDALQRKAGRERESPAEKGVLHFAPSSESLLVMADLDLHSRHGSLT